MVGLKFGEFSDACTERLGIDQERRPANALCVEYMTPTPRCKLQSPDGRGLAWLLSGGSALAYGRCCRESCPRLNDQDFAAPTADDSVHPMPQMFDDVVKKIADRITRGGIILSERIRSGKKRAISLGPYHTATATKRSYAMIITPPLPNESDVKSYTSAHKAALEFVRLVGVEEARDAIVRESRKRLG